MHHTDAERFRVELGKKIRLARHNAGLRQEDLGKALGVDQGRISLWENGRVVPGLIQLVDIALTCRTRPEALLGGIVAPSFEQLGLQMDARTNGLLYDIAALIVRGSSAGEAAVGVSNLPHDPSLPST